MSHNIESLIHQATLEAERARQRGQATANHKIEELQEVLRDGRIGEIIAHVHGDDRLQQMFEEEGGIPEEHIGKPAGIIALEMGIITHAEKNALLAGQAAARTLDALETDRPLALSDDVFKWVGSERDPDLLKEAQTNMMAAHHFNGREDMAEDFKAASSEVLAEASQVLRESGRTEIADQFEELSMHVAPENTLSATPISQHVEDELAKSDLTREQTEGLERVNRIRGVLAKDMDIER